MTNVRVKMHGEMSLNAVPPEIGESAGAAVDGKLAALGGKVTCEPDRLVAGAESLRPRGVRRIDFLRRRLPCIEHVEAGKVERVRDRRRSMGGVDSVVLEHRPQDRHRRAWGADAPDAREDRASGFTETTQ